MIQHRVNGFPATTSLPGVIEKKAKGLSCDRKSRDIDESLLGDICIINVGEMTFMIIYNWDVYDHLCLFYRQWGHKTNHDIGT